MNRSGGLRWHARAWHSQALWQGTCKRIGQWLDSAPRARQELLIIGASAGWMMPGPWLQGFQKISTWDIDPWAAPLFRWRHGRALKAAGSQLLCHTGDALSQLDAVLRANPNAAVLFDNVLGQLRFGHESIEQTQVQLASITASLCGRQWGSVHDVYSGAMQPARSWVEPATQQSRVQALPPRPENDLALLPSEFAQFSGQLNAQGEWLDHLTASVFPTGTVVHHIVWPFSRRYGHWLQAGWVGA